MPRSKHRHKNQGKAIKRPGQHAKPPALPVALPDEGLEKEYFAFAENYSDKVHAQFPDTDADVLLDMIASSAFDADTKLVSPVAKAEVFKLFTNDGKHETATPEAAEAALAFLVEHGYALVEGDRIFVPAQFIPKAE
jgi:hypothetical protein